MKKKLKAKSYRNGIYGVAVRVFPKEHKTLKRLAEARHLTIAHIIAEWAEQRRS